MPNWQIIRRALPWWIGALVLAIATVSIALSRGDETSETEDEANSAEQSRDQELADQIADAAKTCRSQEHSPIESVPQAIDRRPVDFNELAATDGDSTPTIEGVDAYLLDTGSRSSTVLIVPVGDDEQLYRDAVLGPAGALTSIGWSADQLILDGKQVLALAAPNEAPTAFFGRVGCYGVVVKGADPVAAREHSSYLLRPPAA